MGSLYMQPIDYYYVLTLFTLDQGIHLPTLPIEIVRYIFDFEKDNIIRHCKINHFIRNFPLQTKELTNNFHYIGSKIYDFFAMKQLHPYYNHNIKANFFSFHYDELPHDSKDLVLIQYTEDFSAYLFVNKKFTFIFECCNGKGVMFLIKEI